MTKKKDNGYTNVLQNPKYRNQQLKPEDFVATTSTQLESAAHNDRLTRFNARQGAGYAAEQGNNLIDTLHGRKVEPVGDNLAKNGADRSVNGQLIQTKYYQTAQQSVNSAFGKDGQYKYLDNGKPMQLEVPSEQYEKAIEIMRKKIAEGKVPGTTDPNDAEKLVRKGNITYRQSVQLAKAGTIESLTFDAVHGAVIAANTFGIATTITFAKAMWDGEEPHKAMDMAMYNGFKMGGIAFGTSVLSAQLTRTGLNKMLLGPSIDVVKLLPSKVRHAMVNAMREGASIYGGAATQNLAKLLRSNVIASGAFILVMSAGDICDAFRGRISAKQLFKNIMTVVGGVGGATIGGVVGATVGSFFGVPTIGYYVGSVVGGTVGGSSTNAVMNKFIEDDAVEMLRIINERLVIQAQEYLLGEDELEVLLEDLNIVLVQEKMLLMFASKDRIKFADDMLKELIEKIISWRVRILLPPDNEIIESLGRVCEMCADGIDMEKHLAKTKIDPVQVGKELLGKDISKHAAVKAMYVTKQMNLTLMQNEMILNKMSANEQSYAIKKQQSAQEIEMYKAEVNKIMVEYCCK